MACDCHEKSYLRSPTHVDDTFYIYTGHVSFSKRSSLGNGGNKTLLAIGVETGNPDMPLPWKTGLQIQVHLLGNLP
jgi:hypothetical protein